ncbi:related to APN2 - AP endonuclease, exonuclease III homolog [Pseudozyma flocculosa]|uniref:DNA-(apurinic or apyrimidinic site) endonuclease n=1 Tax=Pseudozyma flocculosa TaxID=84751 RepID=A0A5C3EUL5_9BASI|nr:related to APN2 - AP endonuclease, exonuclease III homolog [Pseudozyma flocculosa]
MRIVVWNINGLRTLRGYQPWYQLKDWQSCLEHLDADIACFQETKMTRKQLQEWIGTVTYVKKDICIPLKAEQGITGRLVNTDNPAEAIGAYPRDVRDDVEPALWNALDAEGRAVVLDCGLFVLFNLYAPNETGPERLEYKMSYYHCLEERANRLIQEGRQVMIVGDMNIIRDRIDHCDPEQSLREHGWTHFKQHPARTWYDAFLAPKGKFHDVGRLYHPTRAKMFTNWNTLIDARPANYGVRLDYTLVTEGLLPWIKGADIQPDIYGSDHCPIYLDMHDSREIDGRTVYLKDLMHGGSSRPPPPLAACFYDEFSGKQRKLASFFSAAKKPPPTPPLPAATDKADGMAKEVGASEASPQAEPRPGAPENGEISLADALFALQAPATSEGPTSAMIPEEAAGVGRETTAAADPPKGVAPSPSPLATSAQQKARLSVSASPPKRSPAASQRPSSSSTSSSSSLRKTSSKVPPKGQMRLQAFFTKPSAPPPSAPPALAADAETSTTVTTAPEAEEQPSQTSVSTTGPDAVHQGRSRSSSPELIESFEEADPSSPQKHARTASSTSSNGSASTLATSAAAEPSAAERVEASMAWGAIFAPLPPPTCRVHGETAKAWRVNKPGPNHGRKFWLCSRPVGPGYEKSGRAKGDVNPEYRCNFFQWDSEWKGEASKRRRREEHEACEAAAGVSFAEVGKQKRATAGGGGRGGAEMIIGSDDGAPHKRVKSSK